MTSSEPSLLLEDQLCFALYDASRAVMGLYRSGLAELGLTYTQYVVLLVLWDEPKLTVTRLGERLNLDSGTLSPLLKRLESQGLVRRQRSEQDERVVDVNLTDAGHAIREDVYAVRCQVGEATGIEEAMLDGLREKLNKLSRDIRSTSA